MSSRQIRSMARKLGYEIVRGSYYNTCSDRADRWYVQRLDVTVVDRTGSGYCTLESALDSLL